MELLKAALLGIIQGLTEFLPVSSSGHLVIGAELLDFSEQGLAFDVFLHLGTLLAVVVVFRRDIWQMVVAFCCFWRWRHNKELRRFLLLDLYIIAATLPAVVVGLVFKERIEALFTSTLIAYYMLIVTGLLMIFCGRISEGRQPMSWWRALIVGCAQACAVLPGLSRSGSTIFAGMVIGIPRQEIARFSFLMSIPVILGATVLQGGDLLAAPPAREVWLSLLVGVVCSAVAGYLAIYLLLDVIRRNRLPWFGYYCLCVAALGLGSHLFFSY